MAEISNVGLDLEVVDDVAFVTVSYRIDWSSYDRRSNQPYRESCALTGEGTVFPQLLFPPLDATASDGRAFTDRAHTKPVPLAHAEGIRARVTLTPVLPAAVTRESAFILRPCPSSTTSPNRSRGARI